MLAAISHDAGGAEIISSWLLQQNEPYIVALDGPALSIFERKINDIQSLPLESAIEQADWILTGTSWPSCLEFDAISIAKKNEKKSVSFLDHWVNYQQRFEREGNVQLPDEIWVGDQNAYSIANEVFSDTQIVLKKNPYFEEIKLEINNLKKRIKSKQTGKTILYVCTPFKEHALLEFGDEKYWGFTEEDAVRYFMSNLSVLGNDIEKVILRPHPSEDKDKYQWAIHDYGLNIEIGGYKTLLEEINDADIVIGCNSMAMVIGLIANKRVISGLPPGKKECNLPMAEIEHLQNLIKEFKL